VPYAQGEWQKILASGVEDRDLAEFAAGPKNHDLHAVTAEHDREKLRDIVVGTAGDVCGNLGGCLTSDAPHFNRRVLSDLDGDGELEANPFLTPFNGIRPLTSSIRGKTPGAYAQRALYV
jgi:hypothetical protein